MASAPVRDQLGDHLITPQNAALVLIDYQPSQFATVRSVDPDLLRKNVVSTVRTARAFGLPIVHSTVNVASGQQQPTVPELAELLEEDPPIDRTTVNSWEDVDFVAAVRGTGRRKLIFCALWTEVCMAFAALDALREGYEIYPVVDAIGGTSVEAHRAGIERVVHAGGVPIGWVSLACELQRDWNRVETVPQIVEIVLTDRLLRGMTPKSEQHAVSGGVPQANQAQRGRNRTGRSAVADPTAREFLARADPVLRALIDARPDFHPRAWLDELPPLDAFGTLVFQVVGQQLSVRATRAIVSHLQERFGGQMPSPQALLAADPQELRASGMSTRKGATLRAIAECFRDGRLSDQSLAQMTDEEIEAALTEVPGIGPWTAHSFLIVALDRPDVLLSGDLALRRAVQRAYGFDHLPTEDEMVQVAERWRPYRSLAVSYLFASEFEKGT